LNSDQLSAISDQLFSADISVFGGLAVSETMADYMADS
jgi:hypothetical protein